MSGDEFIVQLSVGGRCCKTFACLCAAWVGPRKCSVPQKENQARTPCRVVQAHSSPVCQRRSTRSRLAPETCGNWLS